MQAGIQTAIQELAAERVALGTMRPTLAGYAAKAMREAIAAESGDIKTLTKHSLSQPLLDIEQAASHVRQNVRETRWLTISLYVVLGMALGLAAGYLPLRADVNQLVEHVNQIDGYRGRSAAAAGHGPSAHTPAVKQEARAALARLMDLTLAREGELGTRAASHKPTASAADAKLGSKLMAFNPDILTWARSSAGLSVDEAAQVLGFKNAQERSAVERLEALETGKEEPSRSVLLKMAKAYHRSLLVFYLNEPPRTGDRGQDFRRDPGADPEQYDPTLDALIRDIRGRQSIVKDLQEQDENSRVDYVGSATMAVPFKELAPLLLCIIAKFRMCVRVWVSKAADLSR